MSGHPVFFEQALTKALETVKQFHGLAQEVTLLRDFRGRIRLLLPGSAVDYRNKEGTIKSLAAALSAALGGYGFPPEQMILYNEALAVAANELSDRFALAQSDGMTIHLLDRQITGQDWLKDPFASQNSNPRATLFGVKGGVGRSTALIIWAWHLAQRGKKVLVFDLDLESPGVSSTLLPLEAMPDFGIVDWFVEDGVGQGDLITPEMLAVSPLASGSRGDIKIVPAFGSKTGEYLPKLARCYAQSAEAAPWGERLERMVTSFERNEQPDLVLLDSRAGVHDIAAVAITRMNAFSLLFAVDSAQTWRAYSFLFNHWKRHARLSDLRQRMQIVAAMVPETNRGEHLKRFREHAWDLFRECLYDEVPAEAADAFSFDLNDEEAPHYPAPVFWHRALQEFEPCAQAEGIEGKMAAEAMGLFMDRADRLVFAGVDEDNAK